MQIIKKVGSDNLLLEATDAPHVGASNSGVQYAEVLTPEATFEFVDAVAHNLSAKTQLNVDQLLRGACNRLVD
ncbi:hypothetical protein D3C86_2058240 [compost metagenome]